MAQEVHGPDYNLRTEDIDGDVLMRVGGGKRHGQYRIADGQSTRCPFPLCLWCEQGVQARAQPYDLGRCWGLVLKCYELRTRQHRKC
jgi:hypothetical protein